MNTARRVTGLLALGLLGLSTQARAQASFSTAGFFSGAGTGTCTNAPSLTASCTNVGTGGSLNVYTLVFTGTSYLNATGAIDFGTFDLTGTGSGSLVVPPGFEQFFNLVITQSNPSAPSALIQGTLAGTITTGQTNTSTLFFAPSATTFQIGAETYTFGASVYNIGLAGGGGHSATLTGTVANTGPVTTTPEPSSIALLATAIASLIPMALRRRKSAT